MPGVVAVFLISKQTRNGHIYIYIYICIGFADAHGMAAGARLLLLLDDPPGIGHGVHVRSRLQRGQQTCKYVCMA